MIEHLKAAVSRYTQAAAGLFGIGGVALTSLAVSDPKTDLTTKIIGAVATFLAFLTHRNLAMKDVNRVVSNAVAKAVFAAMQEIKKDLKLELKHHEDECRWVIRPSRTNPPDGG